MVQPSSVGPLTRSTKAGAEAPATPAGARDRRPWRRRSTKAGAEAPATRSSSAGGPPQSVRSTKAGAEAPATRLHCGNASGSSSPLNEGRGRSPGDTGTPLMGVSTPDHAQRRPGPKPRRHASFHAILGRTHRRSTKAGAEAPATHAGSGYAVGRRARSTKAGAEAPATRAGAADRVAPRRRSTKAGAEAPATPAGAARFLPRFAPLNEGRGRSPGDTREKQFVVRGLDDRSTKAGAEAPATPAVTSAVCCRAASAQRRPGPKPRRHMLFSTIDVTA